MRDAHTPDHISRSVATLETDAAPVAPASRSWSWPGGGRLRGALPGGPGEALWLFVTLRLAFSLFALLASLVFRLARPCSGKEVRPPLLHATGLDFRLLGVWQDWDACWYERIATVGYQPGDPSVNFFPLYPLLMRVTGMLLGGNLTLGGLVVSSVTYVAAMVGLYRLTCYDSGERVARRALLYISVFPTTFFAPFTESLFRVADPRQAVAPVAQRSHRLVNHHVGRYN